MGALFYNILGLVFVLAIGKVAYPYRVTIYKNAILPLWHIIEHHAHHQREVFMKWYKSPMKENAYLEPVGHRAEKEWVQAAIPTFTCIGLILWAIYALVDHVWVVYGGLIAGAAVGGVFFVAHLIVNRGKGHAKHAEGAKHDDHGAKHDNHGGGGSHGAKHAKHDNHGAKHDSHAKHDDHGKKKGGH